MPKRPYHFLKGKASKGKKEQKRTGSIHIEIPSKEFYMQKD
jgi:hypothetical protein